MLGATVGNKRHPDMENVPPETSVANGSSSTGKGRRFFKAHGRKKTCSQQSEEDSPSHCQDEQKEPATGRKLVRRTSSVGQISLRVAPFLKNLRSRGNHTHSLPDQPTGPSVRFDLTRNQNHCYEDENYMNNNPQYWSSLHASDYDHYMSGGSMRRPNDNYFHYSHMDESATNRATSESEYSEVDMEDYQEQVHGTSSGRPPIEPSDRSAGLNPARADRFSHSSAGSCAEDASSSSVPVSSATGQLSRVCDCSTAIDDSNRQPLALRDRNRAMSQTSKSSVTSDTVSDGGCASKPVRLEPPYPMAERPKRRSVSADSGDKDQLASPAKRLLLKPLGEYPAEIQQRVQHLQAEVSKEEEIERQACQALEVCQARSSKISDEELAAERLLLLAGTKVGRCQSELRLLQRSDMEGSLLEGSGSTSSSVFIPSGQRPCVSTIHVSDVCLPLHLGYLASLGRDSAGHFLIMCRCGPDVVAATKVKGTRDSVNFSSGLVFDDVLTLDTVHCDSQVDFEIYYFTSGKAGAHEGSNTSVMSTPTKLKFPGSDSQTMPTPKKGLLGFKSGEYTSSPSRSPAVSRSGPKTTRFQLVASSVLPLSAMRKHTQLKLQEWSSQHVVFGHVFATVTGRPHYEEHQHSGFLTWREEVDGIPNWRRLWCQQVGTVIKAWLYPSDKDTKDPLKILDLTLYTDEKYSLRVDVADPDVSIRKFSLMLTAMPPRKVGKAKQEMEPQMHVFSADSRLECSEWIDALQRIVDDLDAWRTVPPTSES